jgi:integrase
LESGERFALLIDRRTGFPLPETTRYSAVFRRTKEGSVSTMLNELQAIAMAMAWAECMGIDLNERIEGTRLFTSEEVLSLCNGLRERHGPGSAPAHGAPRAVVCAETHHARCHYVREYIAWRMTTVIHRLPNDDDRFFKARTRLDEFRNQVQSLMPKVRERARIGLPSELQDRFLEVIHPDGPHNPFQSVHRHRNHALLLLYYELGLRRAEPLVIKGADLNLSQIAPTVTIHRRADDPSDPRARQPLTKTAGRVLAISENLRAALETFILRHRSNPRKYRNAKKTPFVFVARSGRPLSLNTVYDMFQVLRSRFPEFPADFSPHILRHSWNDRFSDLADGLGTPKEEEEQARNYLMGWKKTSTRAATYTQRSTRRQANEAILRMQKKSLSGRSR